MIDLQLKVIPKFKAFPASGVAALKLLSPEFEPGCLLIPIRVKLVTGFLPLIILERPLMTPVFLFMSWATLFLCSSHDKRALRDKQRLDLSAACHTHLDNSIK